MMAANVEFCDHFDADAKSVPRTNHSYQWMVGQQ